MNMTPLLLDKATIAKYDVAGPRYTSYPTAPEWSSSVNTNVYVEKLKEFGRTDKSLSLYFHIPFCQSMCYFCACNVVIRRQEDKYGDEYIDYLSKEMDLITQLVGKRRRVKQFHWGGGTPTYLTESQIERLFHKTQESFDIDFDGEVAIEIDPRTIDRDKVLKLKQLGFNRISMGIQDFNEEVQDVVNRHQPYDMVRRFLDWCREFKFYSINCDLIYGLPNQTPENFKFTIEKICELKPDRIALYSYAHVPWLKKHQNRLNVDDLPTNDEKLEIFLQSRQRLMESGYEAIAMDHFALESDELATAFRNGTLYRNFMGYTVKPADEFIGLGVTAIGFLQDTFIQNHKILREYYRFLNEGILPIERGKILTRDDVIRQWVIHSLMCRFCIDKNTFKRRFDEDFDTYFEYEKSHLENCVSDQLITLKEDVMTATELGKIFIRNVCMGFDWYLRQDKAHRRFSRTV